MILVRVMGGGLHVPAQGLGGRLLLDVPQNSSEPCDVRFTAQVSNGLPGQLSDLGKQYGNGITASAPLGIIPKSLRDDLEVNRVYSYGCSRCRSNHKVAVGAVDYRVPDMTDRNGLLERTVTLIGPPPLISESASRVGGS